MQEQGRSRSVQLQDERCRDEAVVGVVGFADKAGADFPGVVGEDVIQANPGVAGGPAILLGTGERVAVADSRGVERVLEAEPTQAGHPPYWWKCLISRELRETGFSPVGGGNSESTSK